MSDFNTKLLEQSLEETFRRAGGIISLVPSGGYTRFPYLCDQATVLFIEELCNEVIAAVVRAQSLLSHIDEKNKARAEASYVLASRLSKRATEDINFIEGCLERKHDIHGTVIDHGELGGK